MQRGVIFSIALVMSAGCSNGSSSNNNVPPATPTAAPASCGSTTANAVFLSPSDVADATGSAARHAAAAYRAHSPVVLCGGQADQLARVLGLHDAGTFAAHEAVTQQHATIPVGKHGMKGQPFHETPPPVPTPEPDTPAKLAVVGYYLSHAGVVESFSGFIASPSGVRQAVDDWLSQLSSPQEGPSIGSWHQVFTNTENYANDRGNILQVTFSYWRLNNFNTKYDWYMETQRVLAAPKWEGCEFARILKMDGFIGWFSTKRSVGMAPSGNPDVILYEHAPRTTESTKTASFSIGGGLDLSASGPGGSVSAEYSQSWSQADVTIRDRTQLPISHQEVLFSEPDLSSWASPQGCPAETARTAFDTPHASIFQVRQGQSLKVYSITSAESSMWNPVKGHIINYMVDKTDSWVAYTPEYTFEPSVFEISPRTIRLSPAHRKATIHIQARSGDANLGWFITNQPDWVVLSQSYGLGDKDVTIEAQANTPKGSIANLNLDTDPKGGANNVETGPLILRIEKD